MLQRTAQMKSSKNGSSKVSFERLQAKYYIKQDFKRTPVVFFLDDFFHRSIILIKLVAMALHHVEEVPEHFYEQLRQFSTFLWTMQFLSETKNATCGLSWGRCRCRGRRTCLSELQISSGIRRLAECERIWWHIMTSVTIADHFWWYIMKGFDWGTCSNRWVCLSAASL